MTINSTIAERGARYGVYMDQAIITQLLRDHMRYHCDGNLGYPDTKAMRIGWIRLAQDQRDALDHIASKIARILNGDPNYIDNWHDIQGYAKLVEDRLQSEQNT